MSPRGSPSRMARHGQSKIDQLRGMSTPSPMMAQDPHPGTLARSLSATHWTDRSRSRSSTAEDIASAKSRAKVSGILGLDDGSVRSSKSSFIPPPPSAASTARGRQMPIHLRTQPTPTSCSGWVAPNALDDVSPISVKSSYSPATKLPTAWRDLWVWYGGGRSPQRYRGFDEDRDMHMVNGDTAIYFSEEGFDEDKPMLRVHSDVLRRANSAVLNDYLQSGAMFPDALPTPPHSGLNSPDSSRQSQDRQEHIGSSSTIREEDESVQSDGQEAEPRTSREGGREPREPQKKKSDAQKSFLLFPSSSAGQSAASTSRTQGLRRTSNDSRAQTSPTPSSSQASRSTTSPVPSNEVEIAYELWLCSPDEITDKHQQRRRHLATRNFFALLYGHPLVGGDFYEMLMDLQQIMQEFYEQNDDGLRENVPNQIITFLKERSLDDLRGNVNACLSLLKWCEEESVRWEEGYLEAFSHCAGMMSQCVMESNQFFRLQRITKHNLENAYNGLQLRILDAEEKLATFDLSELWHIRGADHVPAHKSYNAFRDFLFVFYSTVFNTWPPPKSATGHWLTRDVAQRLQQDFGAVYDYMVDMDAAWDVNEERPTRKWEIRKKSPSSEPFHPDSHNIPVTDMLVAFDTKYRQKHIPHPFPLTPSATIAPSSGDRGAKKRVWDQVLRRSKTLAHTIKDPKEAYQIALAYNAATNIGKFGSAFPANQLTDRLERYEKTQCIGGVTPYEARMGRWILIYGVLQILSQISVDNKGLKYTESCQYFLCPTLNGCPPWYNAEIIPRSISEARQEESYCWKAPTRWERLRRPTLPLLNTSNFQTSPSSVPASVDSSTAPVGTMMSYSAVSPLTHRGQDFGTLLNGSAGEYDTFMSTTSRPYHSASSPTGIIAELDSMPISNHGLPPYSEHAGGPPPPPEKGGADFMKPVPELPASIPEERREPEPTEESPSMTVPSLFADTDGISRLHLRNRNP